MKRMITKYPSNYVRASYTPKSTLANADYKRLATMIRNGEPIAQSDYDALVDLRNDYDNACKSEMRKPAQRCDMGYAMYMRDNALEVKQLLESAVVE